MVHKFLRWAQLQLNNDDWPQSTIALVKHFNIVENHHVVGSGSIDDGSSPHPTGQGFTCFTRFFSRNFLWINGGHRGSSQRSRGPTPAAEAASWCPKLRPGFQEMFQINAAVMGYSRSSSTWMPVPRRRSGEALVAGFLSTMG